MHPGGPREGWETQFKKKHWEFNYTNDVSLANPEPLQVTDKDQLSGADDFYRWKESYTYGAGGERISMTYLPAYDKNNGWDPHDGTAGAEKGVAPRTLWYLNDALGSAVGLIEKDGRVSSRYHYDEFGIPTDAKKFDVNWPGPDNLFGYTGLGYDYYSGMSYARARYYKPELGRFISEDTYKGSLWNPQSQNGYSYVANNPLRYTDHSGHCLEDLCIGEVAGLLWLLRLGMAASAVGAGIGVEKAIESAAPKEAPDVSIPTPPSLQVIQGGKSNVEPDNKSRPAPVPVPNPNDDDNNKNRIIYRLGSDSPWNMTPRWKDRTTGLSFQLTKPIDQAYVETTIGAVNATGILVAIIDGKDHVSVRPTDGNLEYWASQRDTAKDSYEYNTRGYWDIYTTTMLNVIGSYEKWVGRKE
jgi:RHS repeat-associated protein